MNNTLRIRDTGTLFEKAILCERSRRFYKTTTFVITLCETVITEFDINNFIVLGLRVVRFTMVQLTESDKLRLLSLLEKAMKFCCEKYNVSTWPIALSADVPNACIKTGLMENKEDNINGLFLKENSIVVVTCDKNYLDKCNASRIFIDDPYSVPCLKPGTEITIDFGAVVMKSIEKINDQNVKCKVISEGSMQELAFVCIRGIKHTKPALIDKDLEVIEFAKMLKFDIITINSVRTARTVQRVRDMTKEYKPLVMSAICEQEGLDNIDSIIKASDGIILAGDFIACEILNKYKLITIQLYVSGKCRKYGKPMYLSGKILHSALITGNVASCDISDITNAVLQRSGFVLQTFKDPANLVKALRTLHEICAVVEPLTSFDNEFMRIAMEYKMPVTAAQAAVLACILLAKLTQSLIIIVPTVTGRTVRQVVHMTADNIVIAITSSSILARQLQLFKGVIALVYDKKPLRDWQEEIDTRLKFAVASGLKFEIMKRGSPYVVLRKSYPTTSYCDQVSACEALSEEDIIRLECTRKSQLKKMQYNYDNQPCDK